MNLDFNINDIQDKDWYIKRARAEAKLCYDTPSTRKGRTWDDLYASYRQGHAPEAYLIENFGYKDDTRKFKDVFNPNGESVEVKTTRNKSNVKIILNDLANIKNDPKQAFRKIPNIVYMWLVDDIMTNYKYFGKFEWTRSFYRGYFKQTSKTSL